MKVHIFIPGLVFLVVTSAAAFAGPSPQAAASQTERTRSPANSAAADSGTPTKIDPVKEADIRKLMEMTGAANVGIQVMDAMQENLKQYMTNSLPPGDYRDKLIELFFEKFRSKANSKQLVDMTVQIYSRYLSDDEIKGLIQFYSTPLGQKMASVLPKLAADSQTESMKWGQNIGQQSMLEVLSEHPELAKALQDAAQSAR